MELLDTPPSDPFRRGEKPVVVIETFGGLKIRAELDPAAAPITVAYFMDLVESGFYDGLKFHRIVPGFLVQGGDPSGTGDGETEYYVKGEFSSNGVPNAHPHTRGTLSLARQDGADTASCQFFILLNEVPSMDGEYAAFGQVIQGMDIVDGFADTPLDAYSRPFPSIFMRRVYLE